MMNTMLLSEQTADLESLLSGGKEAIYFASEEELLTSARRYLEDAAARRAVADGGRKRIITDGHAIVDRARQIVNVLEKLI